ncbi:MAG: GNAT family N-acetyltransferase [candidate division WOR-3 bacterium]|nr:GNAT family N-acetyltransferase [candidate division WOR-3 bacterium]
MHYTIREAEKEDLIEVSKIEELSFNFGKWGLYFFMKFIENAYNRIILVEKNGEILGYCAYTDEGNSIHIKNIAVHPNHRRRGIGSLLIDKVRKLKKDIYLEVVDDNIVAIKFYENIGFRKVEEIKKFYSNGKSAYRYYLNKDE